MEWLLAGRYPYCDGGLRNIHPTLQKKALENTLKLRDGLNWDDVAVRSAEMIDEKAVTKIIDKIGSEESLGREIFTYFNGNLLTLLNIN